MDVIVDFLASDHSSSAFFAVVEFHAGLEKLVGSIGLSDFVVELGQIDHTVESVEVLFTKENANNYVGFMLHFDSLIEDYHAILVRVFLRLLL